MSNSLIKTTVAIFDVNKQYMIYQNTVQYVVKQRKHEAQRHRVSNYVTLHHKNPAKCCLQPPVFSYLINVLVETKCVSVCVSKLRF